MEGRGVLQVEKQEDSDDEPDNGDMDMKPEELTAALEKSNTTLAETISKAVVTGMTTVLTEAGIIKKAEKSGEKAAPAKDDTPVFKGERTAKNLKRHRLAVRHHILQKTLLDPELSSEAYAQADADLEKIESEIADLDAEAASNQTPEQQQIAKLEKQIADIRKRSNRRSKGDDDGDGKDEDKLPQLHGLAKGEDDEDGFSKDDARAAKNMAAYCNGN